jgi:ribosomal protein S18 acetylase RimI-like enzyme
VIRLARPGDRSALYDICLRTGDGGADASARHEDPLLLGHVYLGAYLSLEPDLALVLADDADRPQGYCVATTDTEAFARGCEQSWWPDLRRRYPLAAARAPADHELVELIHDPPREDPEVLATHPGHLHIDLLPQVQGRGLGSALLHRMLDALCRAGCPAVHVGVAAQNDGAVAFYRRVGFEVLATGAGSVVLGRPTARGGPGSQGVATTPM